MAPRPSGQAALEWIGAAVTAAVLALALLGVAPEAGARSAAAVGEVVCALAERVGAPGAGACARPGSSAPAAPDVLRRAAHRPAAARPDAPERRAARTFARSDGRRPVTFAELAQRPVAPVADGVSAFGRREACVEARATPAPPTAGAELCLGSDDRLRWCAPERRDDGRRCREEIPRRGLPCAFAPGRTTGPAEFVCDFLARDGRRRANLRCVASPAGYEFFAGCRDTDLDPGQAVVDADSVTCHGGRLASVRGDVETTTTFCVDPRGAGYACWESRDLEDHGFTPLRCDNRTIPRELLDCRGGASPNQARCRAQDGLAVTCVDFARDGARSGDLRRVEHTRGHCATAPGDEPLGECAAEAGGPPSGRRLQAAFPVAPAVADPRVEMNRFLCGRRGADPRPQDGRIGASQVARGEEWVRDPRGVPLPTRLARGTRVYRRGDEVAGPEQRRVRAVAEQADDLLARLGCATGIDGLDGLGSGARIVLGSPRADRSYYLRDRDLVVLGDRREELGSLSHELGHALAAGNAGSAFSAGGESDVVNEAFAQVSTFVAARSYLRSEAASPGAERPWHAGGTLDLARRDRARRGNRTRYAVDFADPTVQRLEKGYLAVAILEALGRHGPMEVGGSCAPGLEGDALAHWWGDSLGRLNRHGAASFASWCEAMAETGGRYGIPDPLVRLTFRRWGVSCRESRQDDPMCTDGYGHELPPLRVTPLSGAMAGCFGATGP